MTDTSEVNKAALHDLSLAARKTLTTDVQDLLEGVYGLSDKGVFTPAEKIPAIRDDSEIAETRRLLEQLFADETSSGMPAQEAYRRLVKEVSFTWTNRLVALRMMEVRGLIRKSLEGQVDSNGFLRWSVSPEQKAIKQGMGNLSLNSRGETGRDRAYRLFLLSLCRDIAGEIAVLFDPESLPSRLFPRPPALNTLISLLISPDLDSSWQAEETIGWVYQYFNEEEKAAVFDRLYKQKKKIQAEDIPAATQLFTPRWIVKYLVQNTLGRQWVQMHPDTRLTEYLDYLVPLQGEVPPVTMKPVRELTLLDPACGTMHFGLVAFDLFTRMYEEEMEKAGTPGWPVSPSVKDKKEIPVAIIGNNIWGADIDLRAIQLSGLTLYLKAKVYNPETKITKHHLAHAGVQPISGEHLEKFVKEAGLTPLYNRILRQLLEELKLAPQLGSLLKIEESITQLVQEEKYRFEVKGRQTDLSGKPLEGFGESAFEEVFWERLGDDIAKKLQEYATAHSEGKESFFAGEAEKGLRLLEVLRRKYDVVLANPPYSGRKNINEILRDILNSLFPDKSGDLYSVFFSRCINLLNEIGRCGIITVHSFMFTSSYEALREEITDKMCIETGCHLGAKSEFELSNPNAQGFVMSVLRIESNEKSRKNSTSIWIRAVKEEGTNKKNVLEDSFKNQTKLLYCFKFVDLFKIKSNPWIYWITNDYRSLFTSLPELGKNTPPRQGLATSDNFRFVRFWWESGKENLLIGAESFTNQNIGEYRWIPYMKGGDYCKWYGNQECIVNWSNNGLEVKNIGLESGKISSRPQNQEYFLKEGINYSFLTSAIFNARITPKGFIFDVAGSSIFPEKIHLILAILNSKFANYTLKLLNPTVNFQVGDLARLPIPSKSSIIIESLVETAITLAKVDSAEDETTYDFNAPPFAPTLSGMSDLVKARHDHLREIENQIDDEVYRLYGITDEDRAAIEAEVGEPPALPTPTPQDLANRWIGYAIGIIMGRFIPGEEGALGSGIVDGTHIFSPETDETLRDLTDADAVTVLEDGHPDDLGEKILTGLNLMLGEETTTEILAVLGGDMATGAATIRSFLLKDYWKIHLQWYRKRPIYWLIQSPKKEYSCYVFHERMTSDSLFLIQSARYLGGRINALLSRIGEVMEAIQTAEGRERKALEKEREQLEKALVDCEELDSSLTRIIQKTDETGKTVGWKPELDDGVILNMAPLRELFPSWKVEPVKFWKELEEGKYDWSYTAMRYWPERVRAACKRNKSYAIAHGLEEEYEG
ncbi:BREX-1 system adenine-specific DNA-methyltransferase PglX [uncultured Methanospirillum sp.]|uniref:BREX-1 system adenine-specific DNA-methyltransferase PglX n=1 Tax=uncultured Methanospirillum sp. TaxID=262503 RepID=UPI0029C6C118|nr:BREX-1 system adenine-specific DNA-methyltransferase PglX [uncultured Methanospirillum sp.]